MSEHGEPNPAVSLSKAVDDLATMVIIGGTSDGQLPQLVAALSAIGGRAAEAGYREAARIAGELVAAAVLGASEPARAAQRVHEGLTALQEAIEKAERSLAEGCLPSKTDEGSGDPGLGVEAPAAVAGPGPMKNITPLTEDPELIHDFIVESRDHLKSVEQGLLTLERDPSNAEAIHSIFRGFHTIKGVAGFLEFRSIQELAHEVETALNLTREGKLTVTPALIDVVLESVDQLSRAVANVEEGESCEGMPGHTDLLMKVQAVMKGEGVEDAASSTPGVTPAETSPAVAAEAKRQGAAQSLSVRVDTVKLDNLVDMVGELVIAQSLVRHNESLAGTLDPRLQRDLSQLARITSEVQRTAMAMRMVPVGQLFQKAARQVRDLSRKVGKQVELVTRGDETEVDKTIAEELADPLMHMVRNALDHGIEPPAARAAAGKPLVAKLTLAAYHQAGRIVVEVGDDGRGLDAAKLMAKARSNGILEENAHLPESEAFRLILEPGFSTAEKVTNISGRGVGMDVVRRHVEKLRGRIDIRSVIGEGTTFFMKLPLTLAIIDGLVVMVGRQRYIVPLFAVREMFRPTAGMLFTVQQRQEMVLVRGRLVPVLRLHRRFQVTPRAEDPCAALLIVIENEGHSFCLMVDELVGKQEVVIKSLGEGLAEVPGVAGGAILGDGRVGLILDMGGLWAEQ
ncbi:MAG: chemotaxis protein CheA [Bryobacterales bacterium]|nr:chemotaxis protein CheA [Bryobacterales bacterium]